MMVKFHLMIKYFQKSIEKQMFDPRKHICIGEMSQRSVNCIFSDPDIETDFLCYVSRLGKNPNNQPPISSTQCFQRSLATTFDLLLLFLIS